MPILKLFQNTRATVLLHSPATGSAMSSWDNRAPFLALSKFSWWNLREGGKTGKGEGGAAAKGVLPFGVGWLRPIKSAGCFSSWETRVRQS